MRTIVLILAAVKCVSIYYSKHQRSCSHVRCHQEHFHIAAGLSGDISQSFSILLLISQMLCKCKVKQSKKTATRGNHQKMTFYTREVFTKSVIKYVEKFKIVTNIYVLYIQAACAATF